SPMFSRINVFPRGSASLDRGPDRRRAAKHLFETACYYAEEKALGRRASFRRGRQLSCIPAIWLERANSRNVQSICDRMCTLRGFSRQPETPCLGSKSSGDRQSQSVLQ